MKNCVTEYTIPATNISEQYINIPNKYNKRNLKLLQQKRKENQLRSQIKYMGDIIYKVSTKIPASIIIEKFMKKYALSQEEKVKSAINILFNTKTNQNISNKQRKQADYSLFVRNFNALLPNCLTNQRKHSSKHYNHKTYSPQSKDSKIKAKQRLSNKVAALKSFQLSQLKYRIKKQHQKKQNSNSNYYVNDQQRKAFISDQNQNSGQSIMIPSLFSQYNTLNIKKENNLSQFQQLYNKQTEDDSVFKSKTSLNKIDRKLIENLSNFVQNFGLDN